MPILISHRASILQRLEDRSIKYVGGCWEFQGAKDSGGYGHLSIDTKLEKVHRISWTIFKGPIPDNINVLHDCDNRPCWNPEHLFLGTQQDNVDDMWSKGRGPLTKGTSNGRAVLNDAQVIEILALINENRLTQAEIGERYGIAQTTVSYIKRRGWQHLKDLENAHIKL